MNYKWISYAIAIGIWNTMFTGILVGILNLLYSYLGCSLLNLSNIVATYIFGYITLFVLNVKIIDEE
jgi:thiamine transporter ThiT